MRDPVRWLVTGAVVLLLTGTVPVDAQQGIVQGRVLEESGTAVAGAAIQIVGTAIGTLTNESGAYRLQVPAGTVRLRVESLGFAAATRSVTVGAGQTVNVDFTLSVSAIELSEIVASLAATSATRAELGIDVERFNAEREMERAAVANVSQLLNGRATGVTITASSGTTGSASMIRVRGATSLTQDNNPIIYVDGVRVSNSTDTGPGSFDYPNGQTISRLNDLNPQDIASIQILKGPTAAALYGSEAAAGVIVIETKRGRDGQAQYTLTVEQGMSNDAVDYPDNYFNLTRNGGITDINDPVIQQFRPVVNPATGDIYARHNPLMDPSTRPFRTGRAGVYGLSAQGGTEAMNYFTSVRHEAEDGTLPNNDLERLSLRGNLRVAPTDKVAFSLSSNYLESRIRLPDNDRSGVGIITNAHAGLPIWSYGTKQDGTRGDCLATVLNGASEAGCAAREGNLTANFDKLMTVENTQDLARFIGSTELRVQPAGWFANRLVVGVDHIQSKDRNYVPLDPDRPFGAISAGFVNDRRTTEQIYTADYAGTFSWHAASQFELASTLGAQYFRKKWERVGCTGEGGFASNTANACDAALTFSGYSDLVESVEVGAFYQQQVSFNDYLYGTAGLRIDDNSGFGENQGAILSPSFNVSAVVSEMPFWNVDFLNQLRLRFAWGKAAQAPSPFAHARTFRPVRLADGGQQLTGFTASDPGNPDLTAERNEEFEVGFDSEVLDGRLSFKFTYYNQETRDAIVASRVAPSTGFEGLKYVNIGAVSNEGVEAVVSALLLDRQNLLWEFDLRASTQDPIVTSLGDQPPILRGSWSGMFMEGYAPGSYYGPVVGSAERGPNGRIIAGSVEMLPGNLSGPFVNETHRYLGRPDPTNQQSLSTSLTLFRHLRLYTLFDRAAGHHKNNDSQAFRSPFIPEVTGSRFYALREVEATPEEQAGLELRGVFADWVFIEPADYVKWRELTATYQLPASLLQRVGRMANTASLTLGARNLHTWTNYSGLDPELRLDGGTDSFTSAEFYTQPPPRSYFARVTLAF
ncbi:MAG TPA: SusC/RagA family TonB-linked outer membrane protein [Longimicrobiales bacterium]|nr:SusC/RagA family TonB-linked outer membrane protein [Longimicrobiales bacterium]